jgi:hypothetical protein
LAKSPQVSEGERAAYLTPEFLAKVEPLDPVKWLPLLDAHRPLRLEQTLFTSITPDAARNRLLEVLPSHTNHVEYIDIGQYMREASTDGKILEWLDNRLRYQTAPTSGMVQSRESVATKGF